MANLSNKIKLYVGSEVDFTSDVIIHNEGEGDYIKEWNLEKAKPTDAQLNALETQANEYEQNLITSKETNKASAKQKTPRLRINSR